MHIDIDVSLDPTLGCGQAHRWKKDGDSWKGVIDGKVLMLTQDDCGFEYMGDLCKTRIQDYFRIQDDLNEIIADISKRDPYVACLSENCQGLRILKQDGWECLATYLLATNANVKRIGAMVESVCRIAGDDLGGFHSFPTPGQILNHVDDIPSCKLGFREGRFIELAEKTENNEIDIDAFSEMDYRCCVNELMKINGVGPKVADCVALFAFDHLDAFPVDARIANRLKDRYGVEGSYKIMSEFGRNKFGQYAGYAQEFLYHSDYINV